MAAVFAAIMKRETDLLATRDKVRQFISFGSIIVMFVGLAVLPIQARWQSNLYFGAFIALQYFFVNKSQIAGAAVQPGLWVSSVLSHVDEVETQEVHTTIRQIRDWLAVLHEFGLVAPPCKSDDRSVRVRLRLRSRFFTDKMTCRMDTFLRVTAEGQATCVVAPRDYIVFAQGFGAENLPGRQELGVRLGAAFTPRFCGVRPWRR